MVAFKIKNSPSSFFLFSPPSSLSRPSWEKLVRVVIPPLLFGLEIALVGAATGSQKALLRNDSILLLTLEKLLSFPTRTESLFSVGLGGESSAPLYRFLYPFLPESLVLLALKIKTHRANVK